MRGDIQATQRMKQRRAHLAAVVGRGQENFCLKISRKQRVYGQDLERRRVVADGGESLLYVVACGLDVLCSSHENEHVSRSLAQMDLQRLLHCSLHVIFLWRLGEHDVDGKGASGNFENRNAAEKICEFGGVQGGRRDDELKVVAAGHYLA